MKSYVLAMLAVAATLAAAHTPHTATATLPVVPDTAPNYQLPPAQAAGLAVGAVAVLFGTVAAMKAIERATGNDKPVALPPPPPELAEDLIRVAEATGAESTGTDLRRRALSEEAGGHSLEQIRY